ncbi:MAG: hypothetical protein GEV10_20655 [Streptosporangiales bacterium]|nr:hypothetical protein [Streptosporangiales bacterium]
MDLTPYVDQLRRDLATAAEAGGDDARALAERLTAPLESATRLALLDALTAAAGEITRDLAPGSVDVRLRGRDADFVVTPPPTDRPADDADTPTLRTAFARAVEVTMGVRPPAPEADEGGTSRVTLRLPEHLKPMIEDAAGREGLSVNAWLVRAVAGALDYEQGRRADPGTGSQLGGRFTGWVR